MKNNLQPEIRFYGYEGNWEKYKLGEHSRILTGGTPKTKIEEYWNPKDIPWMSSGEINKKRLVDTDNYISNLGFDNSSARWVKENSILIALAGQGKTRGTVAINEIPLTTNQSIAAIEINNILNTEFVFQNLQMRYDELRLMSSGDGTRGGLNKKIISEIEIYSPKEEEQQKIGEFFKQLDDRIALQQRHVEQLKQSKQGFLQKMFPKDGESVPEVRFDGFSGEWIQNKFMDTIQSIIDFRGKTPKKLGMSWSETGYPALSALNVKNGFIDFNSSVHFASEELYNAWMGDKELEEGQVLFTTEAPMGNVAQIPDNNRYVLSQRTIAFRVDKKHITNNFLAVLLRSDRVFQRLSALASGGTAKGVSQKSLSALKVVIPINLEEQQKIGEFFKQLDDLIAKNERELELLQETKKGFLQKMFV
jgi:type I restriction enzyme S subunit